MVEQSNKIKKELVNVIGKLLKKSKNMLASQSSQMVEYFLMKMF